MAEYNEGGADYTQTAANVGGGKYTVSKGGKTYTTDDFNAGMEDISKANGGQPGDGISTRK